MVKWAEEIINLYKKFKNDFTLVIFCLSFAKHQTMDPFQVCCLGEKWRLSVGRSRGRAHQNHREAMEEGEQRLLSAKNCSEEEAKELRALLRTYLVTNLKG